MKDPRTIIKIPLITEKTTDLKEFNWYVFSVERNATKNEIKDSVEKIFNVKVEKVRTLTTAGKAVKRFGRNIGKRSPVKKAYIKLKEGTIELFEGV
ncbi:MAG: 50S ribosomal protein L23 [Thermodesulfobacteriota bacterium]